MRTLPKLGAIGASVALAASTMFVGTAGAETIDISAPLIAPPSGLVIDAPGGALTLDAPDGSSFVGAFDDETGELTGDVTIAGGSFTTSTHIGAPLNMDADIEISYEFVSGGPIANGEIDDDGNVSFDDVQTLKLTNLNVIGLLEQELPDSCAFGPLDLAYGGTYDEATNTVTVETEPFFVPPLAAGDCGDIAGIDLAEQIMGAIGYETQAVSTLSFERAVVDMPEPEPDETTTTTVAPAQPAPAPQPAAPAQPVASQPSYTG